MYKIYNNIIVGSYVQYLQFCVQPAPWAKPDQSPQEVCSALPVQLATMKNAHPV